MNSFPVKPQKKKKKKKSYSLQLYISLLIIWEEVFFWFQNLFTSVYISIR